MMFALSLSPLVSSASITCDADASVSTRFLPFSRSQCRPSAVEILAASLVGPRDIFANVARGIEDTNRLLRLGAILLIRTEALTSPLILETAPMTGLFSSSGKTYAGAESVVKTEDLCDPCQPG
jgi:hypothetical protein